MVAPEPANTLSGDDPAGVPRKESWAGESVDDPREGLAGVCGICCCCTRERTRVSSCRIRSPTLPVPSRWDPGA